MTNSTSKIKVGTLVVNGKKEDWGPGKVLAVSSTEIVIYFRDAVEKSPGDAVKHIRAEKNSLRIADSQSDPWLDSLPDTIWKGSRPARCRLTLEQAIQEFSRKFPKLFDDPAYYETERDYKWAAHELFEDTLGRGQLDELMKNKEAGELERRLRNISGKINLLSRQENIAVFDAFKSGTPILALTKALSDVLGAHAPEEASFTNLIGAINGLPAEPGRARVATWPVLTIYPYLARPDTFMFLKPEVTKAAAENLAFNLNYDTKLNWLTYERLMSMSNLLMDRLRPLGARDFIDVQSFIWVTGDL